MTPFDSRKYVGRRFGFSISVPPKDDPAWPAYYGQNPEPAVNEFVFAEGSGILFEGGRLVLGHRWANARGQWNRVSVLAHLIAKSRDYRSFRPVSPDETGTVTPAIFNLLAWPDLPPPPSEEYVYRLIAEGVLEIRQVRPPGFDDAFLDGANDPAGAEALAATPQGQYARVRALTAMRKELVRATDFRLCIGGGLGQPTRRLPGVLEEALLTVHADKPLYLSSAFGGVSKALADCLLQRRVKMDEDNVFFTPGPVEQLMRAQAATDAPIDLPEGPSTRAGWNALDDFRGFSLDKLSAQAGLTTQQYIDLLATPNVDRAMAWIMSGVGNLIQQTGNP